MAQLKVKQISDFVSAVEAKVNGIVGTANVTAISVAKSEAISTAESADVVVLSSAKSYADQAEADAVATASADASTKADVALSSANSYADSKDVIVLSEAKAHSDIQKGRIDALLLNSTEALDTFTEIENFITSLETSDVAGLSAALSTAVSNDAVHTTGIADNVEAISNLDTAAQGYADTAESNAIAEAGRLDAIVLSSANSYADGLAGNYDAAGSADTAEANAIAEAGNLDAIVLSSAKSYADVAEADAISSANTYTDTEIAAIDLRIDGLEGASFEEVVANFVAVDEFTSTLKFDLGNVKVFVNGLQIHEASEGFDGWRSTDGLNFTVVGLGYDLEADDHIIVSGKLA